MPNLFTEDTYEQAIIELFENMGYDHLYAPDFDRDYTSPILDSILRDSLVRINRGLPVEAIDEAMSKLKNFDTGSLLQKNMIFMDYLQNGVTIKFFVKGEEQSSIVRLIDYQNVKSNSFYVVNQLTFLHGFDFSGFVGGSPLTMAKLITGGVNFILDASVPERKDLFLKEAMLLKQSHSLCSSMTTEQERHEVAYMEALRSTVIKITYGGTGGKSLSLTEINDQINELLKAAVQSEGVISLFDSSKSGGENFSLFDPAVLDEISRMKEKNIAVEILKKLMAEQVALYKRTNVVQSQKFSEKIAQLMNSYYNGLITNEEVIKELLKTAEEIANLYKNGQALGLSQEELAFYDALTKPEYIKDFYKNDELIALTRELTEMLRKNRTIDWQKKETARAQMRKMVKRLLKKYKYPPEDYDFAISTVISQCELWTDNVEPRKEEKLYKYVSEIELSKVAEDTVSYGEKK